MQPDDVPPADSARLRPPQGLQPRPRLAAPRSREPHPVVHYAHPARYVGFDVEHIEGDIFPEGSGVAGGRCGGGEAGWAGEGSFELAQYVAVSFAIADNAYSPYSPREHEGG